MLLTWWNQGEAAKVGAELADSFRPRAHADKIGRDIEKLLRHAAREAAPLKLNFFKRAKLLNVFKWRLIEHGFDANIASELTQMLLFQLYGTRASSRGGAAPVARTDTHDRSARRIPTLMAEADAQFAAGHHAQTADGLRRVLRIDPDHALAHSKLGAALCYLGEYPEAERMLRRAVELDPRGADAYLNLGALLYSKGDFAASETALRRAVKLAPRNSEALVALGLTLSARRRVGDAKNCFSSALVLKPRNASALCGLGWLASIEGRFQEGEKFYRDALGSDPMKSFAWASLADIRRMTPADGEWLESVNKLVAAGPPPLEEATLQFALGKYFDDLGNAAQAFPHFKRANELYKLVAKPYDRKARSRFVDDTIGFWDAGRMRERVPGASQSAKPVFVVGMMRSGTSLVEQILASHSRIAGAGELEFWNEAAYKHQHLLRREWPDAKRVSRLADGYLSVLKPRSQEALRVVDKSNFNSDHLGLIHSLFPSARIICVRRDPIDTCLSCYFQRFANAAGFTMDLFDLAHYYREHHRLIEHWRSVLPPAVFLEVPYADLIADQETWSRRMIEFIGLEWEPSCLEFYKTERPVVTASNWQVRQRIYSSSVGRWRNYRKFIGPLLELRELESV